MLVRAGPAHGPGGGGGHQLAELFLGTDPKDPNSNGFTGGKGSIGDLLVALGFERFTVHVNNRMVLNGLLAEDAVFYSPVVHTPQRGRKLAAQYLGAAFHVFFNPTFRYVREIVGPSDAMLEFETEIDGVVVNGVDLIKWNEGGKIVEFKVMLRPLKAINVIHQRMATMLQSGQ